MHVIDNSECECGHGPPRGRPYLRRQSASYEAQLYRQPVRDYGILVTQHFGGHLYSPNIEASKMAKMAFIRCGHSPEYHCRDILRSTLCTMFANAVSLEPNDPRKMSVIDCAHRILLLRWW